MLVQDVESRFAHGAVVVPANLIQIGRGVSHQLHHAPHVGVLLIPSEQLYFPVARDEHQGRRVLADMEQGGIPVDGGLQVGDALHLAVGEVADHLPAEGDQPGNGVGIHSMLVQPRLVQPQHGRQVPAGGMSGEEYLPVAAIVLPGFAESPGYSLCGIVQASRDVHLGQQAIVHRHDHHPAVLQFPGDALIAARQSSAVEPDHHGAVRQIFRLLLPLVNPPPWNQTTTGQSVRFSG